MREYGESVANELASVDTACVALSLDEVAEPALKNRKPKNTYRGARTHDHKVKGLALYRLS